MFSDRFILLSPIYSFFFIFKCTVSVSVSSVCLNVGIFLIIKQWCLFHCVVFNFHYEIKSKRRRRSEEVVCEPKLSVKTA